MKEYVPGGNAVWVLRIWLIIISLPAVFAGGIMLAFSFCLGTAVLAVLAAVFLLLSVVWIPLWLKSVRLSVNDERAEINKGVIFKNSYIMSKRQVIYISRIKTPLSSFFGLCSVKLNAAKIRLIVPLIKKEEADELSDFMNNIM